MNYEVNRLKTFDEWENQFNNKKFLALFGFYYIGPHDRVKCYFCKLELHLFERDDDIQNEHIKWSPFCNLMQGNITANVPINEDFFKQELISYTDDKIKSFDVCGVRDESIEEMLKRKRCEEGDNVYEQRILERLLERYGLNILCSCCSKPKINEMDEIIKSLGYEEGVKIYQHFKPKRNE